MLLVFAFVVLLALLVLESRSKVLLRARAE